MPQNMLKFSNFQKNYFLGGAEGGFGFCTLQNDFIYNYLLFMEGWRPKMPFFQFQYIFLKLQQDRLCAVFVFSEIREGFKKKSDFYHFGV